MLCFKQLPIQVLGLRKYWSNIENDASTQKLELETDNSCRKNVLSLKLFWICFGSTSPATSKRPTSLGKFLAAGNCLVQRVQPDRDADPTQLSLSIAMGWCWAFTIWMFINLGQSNGF